MIRKVGFVGIRTDKQAETVDLLRDCLNADITREEPGLTGIQMADGTVLEIYGPEDEFHSFFKTGPVVGFEVDNFDTTKSAMLDKGVQFIGDPQHDNGTSWQHFHLPDGTIAEIIGPGTAP